MTRLFITIGVRYYSLEMVRLGFKASQPKFQSQMRILNNLNRPINYFQKRHFASDKTPETRIATLDAFSEVDEKTKDTYLDLLHFYTKREARRRGHVEFIYAALKHMKDFGVNKDLEAYKKLMDVMPKGKFVAQNVMQAEFQHYPKQQQCIIDLLEQMEINGVCPDAEMEGMLLNLFGNRSYAIRRYWRMMYWMPKMKNLSPWPVPNPLPEDSLELAKLAIQRITSVDPSTKVTVLQTKDVEDSIDDTWIVSGQSHLQQELITCHDKANPLFVEGSFRVWMKGTSVNYFILRADYVPDEFPPKDPDDISNLSLPLFSQPTEKTMAKQNLVHQQEDGTVMAVCATGSSSRDSLLSWVRLLQLENPRLGEIPVLFTLKSPIGSTEPLQEIEGEDAETVLTITSSTNNRQ